MEVKYVAGSKKRKDGRYCGYAYIEGEQQRHYVYDEDPQEMKRKLFSLVSELENGIIKSDVKFKTYSNHFLNEYCKNLSPTTQNEYKRKIDTDLISELGDKEMRKILFFDIQRIINKFGEIHSEKSQKDLLALISRIFNCAIKHDKIRKDNPCIGVTLRRTESYQYDIYTIEEMQAYLAAIRGSIYEIPITLASLCGMRLGEICGLKWGDIDFTQNKITIRRSAVVVKSEIIVKVTKTRKSERIIIMPKYVAQILLLRRGMPDAYVYPKADGTPENGNLLSKRIRRFREKIGFAHTRFHDLRHFAATALMEEGLPDKQIADMFGHSNVSQTRKYQHILKSIADRPAKIMDNLFGDGTSSVSKSVSNENKDVK